MITPERWEEFLALVRDTRQLQRHHRRTQDPVARRELVGFEQTLDAVADQLTAELAAAEALAADLGPPAAGPGGEGGVP